MRLIDADEIQKYLEDDNTMNEWCVSQYSADWISSFIENRPTVDIKTEVAREIFAEIDKLHIHVTNEFDAMNYEKIKNKYTKE